MVNGFLTLGYFIGLPGGLLIGIPTWFVMEKRGLTPGRGASAGLIIGLIIGGFTFSMMVPIAAAAGAFAGWLAVVMADRLIGRLPPAVPVADRSK